MNIVGIDLGTTNSSVAVPEVRDEVAFTVEGDVSIVRDNLKRRSVPSAVGVDHDGNVIVGHRAWVGIGTARSPIIFSKRYMGTERTWRLGDREVSPREVATEVILELKRLASEQLGEPVERAIITVPAWFDRDGKRQTKQAGEDAGLEVVRLVDEPVAAALAYFRGLELKAQQDPDDAPDVPETILTYDLGGGTFDAAVVSRETGVPRVISSKGDRFLGGHEFDKALALWMAEQLCEKGYDLDLSISPAEVEEGELPPEPQGDELILARLMVIAEQVKIKLSSSDVVHISESTTGITDHQGTPVEIDLTIDRQTFIDMIADDIARTIDYCHRALEPPHRRPLEPDAIVMVGGSSKIPYIAQQLRDKFGIEPLLSNPDMSVVIGAAMVASAAPVSSEWVDIDRPAEVTEQEQVQITGRIRQADDATPVEGWRLTLSRADGQHNQEVTSLENGGFVFTQVPLASGRVNEFTVTGVDPSGQERFSHDLTIEQVSGGAAVAGIKVPRAVYLARPVGLITADGSREIVPEGQKLPWSDEISARTTSRGWLRIPVCEGHTVLGELTVSNIPPEVSVGTEVEISMKISEDYEVTIQASIPRAGISKGLSADLVRPEQASPDELERHFAELERRAEDVLTTASPGQLVEEGRGERVERLRDQISKELDSPASEPERAQEMMGQLEYELNQVAEVWQPDPPQSRRDRLEREIRENIEAVAQRESEVKAEDFRQRLATLSAQADEAAANEDDQAWAKAIEDLEELHRDVESELRGGGPEMTAAEMKAALRHQLDAMAVSADNVQRVLEERIAETENPDLRRSYEGELGELDSIREQMPQCESGLERIDTTAPGAKGELQELWFERMKPLVDDLERLGGTGLVRVNL